MDAPKEIQTPREFKCKLSVTSGYSSWGKNKYCVCTSCEQNRDSKNTFFVHNSFYTLPSRVQRRSISSSFTTRTVVCSTHKRFCLPCVKENLKAFPSDIQEDMDKRKPQQKSCKKQIRSINLEAPRATVLWLGFLLCLETITLLLLNK